MTQVTVRVAAEGAVDAPAEVVYRCIADYRTHHPRIVPPAFSNFVVEEGGVGAGTIVRFSLKLAGRTQTTRVHVYEPEPGHRLEEVNWDRNLRTFFTVTPEGAGSCVRIETVWQPVRGIAGLIERRLVPRLLCPLYADELKRLDQYAQAQATTGDQ